MFVCLQKQVRSQGGARGANDPKVSKIVLNFGHVLPEIVHFPPKSAQKSQFFPKKHTNKSTISKISILKSPLSPKEHPPPQIQIQTWLRACFTFT